MIRRASIDCVFAIEREKAENIRGRSFFCGSLRRMLASWDDLDFTIDRVHLLELEEDSGQFERLAEVGLGTNSTVTVFESPQAFPGMPKEEVEWVYQERVYSRIVERVGAEKVVGVGTIAEGHDERCAFPSRPKSLKPNVQNGKQSAKD